MDYADMKTIKISSYSLKNSLTKNISYDRNRKTKLVS